MSRASPAKGASTSSVSTSIEKTTKKSSMRSGMGLGEQTGTDKCTGASCAWLWIILVGLHGWWRGKDAIGRSRLPTRGAGRQLTVAIVNRDGGDLSAMWWEERK